MRGPTISDKRVAFLFAFAAACQGVYLFDLGGRAFAYLAFGAMFVGAFDSVSHYLYGRGRASAGETSSGIYTGGEDQK